MSILSYRTSGWKYIRCEQQANTGLTCDEEIYNLTDDPMERNNLIDVEIAEILKFKLEALQAINKFKNAKKTQRTSTELSRIRDRITKLNLKS